MADNLSWSSEEREERVVSEPEVVCDHGLDKPECRECEGGKTDHPGSLGTNIIRTEGGQPKDSVKPEQYADAIAGCVEKCLPFLEEKNVRFAIDNHGYVTNDHEVQLAVFEKIGSDLVGANFDTMNYRWFGHDVEKLTEIYDAIAPYTLHTHMKDGTGSRAEYVGAALGDGEIPLDHAVKALKAVGYSGVYCAEYEGQEATDIGYRKCLDWMKANI